MTLPRARSAIHSFTTWSRGCFEIVYMNNTQESTTEGPSEHHYLVYSSPVLHTVYHHQSMAGKASEYEKSRGTTLLQDVLITTELVSARTWHRVVRAWLVMPIAVAAIMAVCFGVDRLIHIGTVPFPASVACLILLFLALILCSFILGDRATKTMVGYLDIPCGWSLRFLNIFLCPGFVTLPLSPPISGTEVAKIIGVALVGWAVVFALSAYSVRGIVLLIGNSKKAEVARAEELGKHQDDIPLSRVSTPPDSRRTSCDDYGESTLDEPPSTSILLLVQPPRAQNPDYVTGTGGPPIPESTGLSSETISPLSILRHDARLQTRAEKWAALIISQLDLLTYAALMVFIGIPVYYGLGYAMPLQLCISIITYEVATMLPLRWKTYLHPILVSSASTVLAIWIFALTRGDSLSDGLHAYSTGVKYTKLWSGAAIAGTLPGAGDILSSIIDVSIIALALPMFQYRHELQKNFLAIIIPNTIWPLASLFGYPAFCYAIGIAPTSSLAFGARTLTLALGQIVVANVGGNVNVGTPLAIFSGIFGVLIGNQILKLLRIPDDDYITRGITFGANSSSLATAMLLGTDPRAAAFSSLSMGFVGTVAVAATSVPPIVQAVRRIVGL